MINPFSWLKRRKKEAEEEEEIAEELRPASPLPEGEPLVLGIISGKGGCGKSTVAANIAILLSALSGGVVAIDLDITNGTLTNMLFYVGQDVLREDGDSAIDYIVEETRKYELYKIEFPPNRAYSIQVAGNPNLGVRVKNLYALPAKKATPSFEQKLSELAHLSSEEVRTSLHALYAHVVGFARERKLRYVIFDFPPLRPDQRKVYDGVFGVLELIPRFILLAPFDASAVHGLVSVIDQRYSYVKPRVLGFLINMTIPSETETLESIRRYIEKIYGRNMVYFIRSDPRWKLTLFPPIILGDPSEGAHYDLIKACVSMGLLEREVVERKLKLRV